MYKVFEEVVGHDIRTALAAHGVSVELQHRTHLDRDHRIKIRPDIVVRRGNKVVAVADLKNKRAEGIDPDDIYQVVGYATKFGLREVSLIYPAHPPYQEVVVGGVRVRLWAADLSLSARERERAVAELAVALVEDAEEAIP